MRPTFQMKCWTERPDDTDPDPYGEPQSRQPVLSDEPCRWYVAAGREQTDQQRSVTIADEHLMLDRDADIQPGDVIVRLVDHENRTIFDQDDVAGQIREVDHIAPMRTFVDAMLRSSS